MSMSDRLLKLGIKSETALAFACLFFFCFSVLSALLPTTPALLKIVALSGFFAPIFLLMIKFSDLNRWLEARNVHGLVAFSGLLFTSAILMLADATAAPMLYLILLFSAPLLLATPVKSATWARVPAGAVALLAVVVAVSFSVESALATGDTLGSAINTLGGDIETMARPAKIMCYAVGGGVTFFGGHECYKAKQGQGDGDLAAGGKKIAIGGAIAGTPTVINMAMGTFGVENNLAK